jgi:hypothetical protein
MVFSYIDMGFLASIGLLLSVGLLWYGRPYIFKQIWVFGGRLIPRRRHLEPAWQAALNLYHRSIAAARRLRSKKEIAQPEDSIPELEAEKPRLDPVAEAELGDLSLDISASNTQKNEVESLV